MTIFEFLMHGFQYGKGLLLRGLYNATIVFVGRGYKSGTLWLRAFSFNEGFHELESETDE